MGGGIGGGGGGGWCKRCRLAKEFRSGGAKANFNYNAKMHPAVDRLQLLHLAPHRHLRRR